MLHGLGGSYLNWLPAAPELAKHARVLAVDLVGFGRTPLAGRSVGVASQRGYPRATRSMLLTLLRRGKFEAWAHGVHVPTLLMHGRQDRWVPFAALRRAGGALDGSIAPGPLESPG